MPTLTLQYKGRPLQQFSVAIGQTLTIGRKESNDIVIDNLAVSGNHARIDSVSATFILTDLQSTNGTFVNRELISAYNLRQDDIITVGKHELVFDRSDLEHNGEESAEVLDDDRTRFLDTSEYRSLISQSRTAARRYRQADAVPVQGSDSSLLFRLLKRIPGAGLLRSLFNPAGRE